MNDSPARDLARLSFNKARAHLEATVEEETRNDVFGAFMEFFARAHLETDTDWSDRRDSTVTTFRLEFDANSHEFAEFLAAMGFKREGIYPVSATIEQARIAHLRDLAAEEAAKAEEIPF